MKIDYFEEIVLAKSLKDDDYIKDDPITYFDLLFNY